MHDFVITVGPELKMITERHPFHGYRAEAEGVEIKGWGDSQELALGILMFYLTKTYGPIIVSEIKILENGYVYCKS